MSEYDKKPANISHTWDNEEEPQASRQAPINEIIQAYMNPVIQCLIIPADIEGAEIKNPYNGQVYPSGESPSGDNEDDLIEEEDK